MRLRKRLALLLAVAALLPAFSGCREEVVVDEAKAAGKTVADFPASSVDYFKGMDDNVELAPDEVKGRNMWILWTGGNEAFWDYLAKNGYGLVDFLKTIDSRRRPERFKIAGLMNEPGYRQASAPDEFGLYLDQPIDPKAQVPDPAVYGKSTGIIGFRLFPNPQFNEEARKYWDANRYYNDPKYYFDPKVIRPYRVGITCAVCHVSFHPLHPPADVENPGMGELTSTLGNQYFTTLGVFGVGLKPDNIFYHLLHSAPPGTVDTSIIATDNNNNPNIINSIFNVEARLAEARKERVAGGALKLGEGGEIRPVPHVLVDGADSVGMQGALDRVFVNIGSFGEEWIRCHNPIIGQRKQKSFSIENAQKNSVYWQVTEKESYNLAKFLIKAGRPMPLKAAPGGEKYITTDQAVLDRGKIAFAENCVACHSSKRPPADIGGQPENYSEWARTEKYLAWARAEVMKPDFLENNFLSTDARIPVTLVRTNASRALQDNATTGHIWAEFSSENYKETPSVGDIDYFDPFSGKTQKFTAPGGGPGFYRVPTLVSVWNSAPLLHNNRLGDYNGDPSVEGRVKAFTDAMTKMFWEDRRQGVDSIIRTTERSWLNIAAPYLPVAVEGIVGPVAHPFLSHPWLAPLLVFTLGFILALIVRGMRKGFLRGVVLLLTIVIFLASAALLPASYFAAGKLGNLKLGPFPKGMPVNLFGSLNPGASPAKLVPAIFKMGLMMWKIEHNHLSDEAALKLLNEDAGPALIQANKCPDWIEDRGHYFAAHLSDEDKAALIEYLKTL